MGLLEFLVQRLLAPGDRTPDKQRQIILVDPFLLVVEILPDEAALLRSSAKVLSARSSRYL